MEAWPHVQEIMGALLSYSSLLNISRSKNMERAVYTVLSISVLLKHHFFFTILKPQRPWKPSFFRLNFQSSSKILAGCTPMAGQ